MWLNIASITILGAGLALLFFFWRDLQNTRKRNPPIEQAAVRAMRQMLIEAGAERLALAEENQALHLRIVLLETQIGRILQSLSPLPEQANPSDL